MKYEVIFKVKESSSSQFEQRGRIVVSPEHLNAQIADYRRKAFHDKYYDYVVLINELTDDGEFVQVYEYGAVS